MLQVFNVVFVWPHHATKSQENLPNDVRKRSNHVRISLKLVECVCFDKFNIFVHHGGLVFVRRLCSM